MCFTFYTETETNYLGDDFTYVSKEDILPKI